MKVRALDHVNIRTERLAETVEFYTQVLGMVCRPPPGRADTTRGAWICDDDGRPIVHVGTYAAPYPNDEITPKGLTPATGSGAINHVALECSGYDETVARLKAANLPVAVGTVVALSLRQLFVEDPNGVTLELNFRGAAAG